MARTARTGEIFVLASNFKHLWLQECTGRTKTPHQQRLCAIFMAGCSKTLLAWFGQERRWMCTKARCLLITQNGVLLKSCYFEKNTGCWDRDIKLSSTAVAARNLRCHDVMHQLSPWLLQNGIQSL
jgi:hypothetical protein